MGDYGAALEGYTFDRARKGAIALGGVSSGAYIALALARRHPRRVDGLLLTVPESYPLPERIVSTKRGSPGGHPRPRPSFLGGDTSRTPSG